MVNDFQLWKGNTYTLAVMVMQRQKEDDAQTAEAMGGNDVAEAIRGQ